MVYVTFMETGSIQRPLDMLNNKRGETVLVEIKDQKSIQGKLLAFDIHINLVIDSPERGLIFIKGDNVILVS